MRFLVVQLWGSFLWFGLIATRILGWPRQVSWNRRKHSAHRHWSRIQQSGCRSGRCQHLCPILAEICSEFLLTRQCSYLAGYCQCRVAARPCCDWLGFNLDCIICNSLRSQLLSIFAMAAPVVDHWSLKSHSACLRIHLLLFCAFSMKRLALSLLYLDFWISIFCSYLIEFINSAFIIIILKLIFWIQQKWGTKTWILAKIVDF